VLLVEITRHILESDRELHLRDHTLFEPYQALEEISQKSRLNLSGSFADRISSLVESLASVFKAKSSTSSVDDIRELDVTEVIYRHTVGELGKTIYEYLRHKSELWLLFDNLDKGWSTDGLDKTDLTLVRGLVEACRKLQ